MPTYSYRCTECDHAFEIHQSFTDDALTTCPECTGALRKLFTGVGVVFKGSGFYRTDSRAGKGSSTATGSSTSDSGNGSGSSAGSGSSSGSDAGSSGSASSPSTSPSTSSKTAATTSS